jgi:hypothetical protein
VVAGPYSADASAKLDEAAGTFTVPLPLGNRFYRIRAAQTAGTQVSITGIRVEGQSLVIKFTI